MSKIEKQYQSNDDRLHAVVDRWLCGKGRDWEPSWRELIWVLDHADENRVADNMRHFAEPVLGMLHDYHNFVQYVYIAMLRRRPILHFVLPTKMRQVPMEEHQSYKTHPSYKK